MATGAGTDAVLARFVAALRSRGVPVTTGRFQDFTHALTQVDLGRRDHVYDVGQVTLCGSPEHLPVYDEVFRAVFDGERSGEDSLVAPDREPQYSVSFRDPEADLRAQEEQLEVPLLASAVEVLRRRDFGQLTDEERDEIAWLLARLEWQPAQRRTRRREPHRRPLLDRRATLREAMRGAGEIRALRRARVRRRPRRVVLLVDVSGSMREYAVAFLRYAHVTMRRSAGPTEVFTLGTRLTRLTSPLRHPDPAVALRRVADLVADWQGGTRLGDGLQAFLEGWGRRGAARGAIVVILSDGWERGDPGQLARQMDQLSRLAHRVIWANPRKSRDGYEPLVSGMAAALPHVDDFVDASNLAALEHLARLVSRHRRRSLRSAPPYR